jgi:TIR domain-containing protein
MTSRDRVTIQVDGNVSGQFVVGDNNVIITGAQPAAQHTIAPAPNGKRVFVSYVREDLAIVNRLVAALRNAGYEVWIDHTELLPGMRWKSAIRDAIAAGDYFLACFSPRYWKSETFMNEELTIAVERLRLMPRDRTWFIPVMLATCVLPDHPIGPGETIADSLQFVDLSTDWPGGLRRIIAALG